MIPRPPISTLFPYTTLFRSTRGSSPTPPPATYFACSRPAGCRSHSRNRIPRPRSSPRSAGCCHTRRSEEHTSELQSRPHLVCRLLLEKKKKKQILRYTLLYT